MKKVIFRVLLVLILGGGVWASYRYFQQLPQKQSQVPITKVRKGDVIVRAYCRGELRAVRSVTLTAPNLFGTVQVTKLAPLGALAKEKDLIVEFDDSERRSQLEETLLEVEQIDEQIKKAKADLAMRNNQDQVELLRSRYGVRRAELELKRNELLPRIDARKNELNLEEARRRLTQLESDIKSRQDQALAELAVLAEKRNKAMVDVARERQRIAQTRMLSPITGLVAIRQNRTMFGSFGQQIPDIREGDTLQPGMPVADILDLSELELIAKVGELDRANLNEGQEVNIRLDAVPEKTFHGKIKSMSGTATSNPFGGDPGKKFDVVFSINMRALLAGLGASPEQIKRVMETAELNAKKAPAATASSGAFGMAMMGGAGEGGGMTMVMAGGGLTGGMSIAGMPGTAGAGGGMSGAGGAQGMQTFRMGGRGGGEGGSGPSEEQRRAMLARVMESLSEPVKKELQKQLGKKKIEELSDEERRGLFRKLRELMEAQGGGGQMAFRMGGPGGQGGRGGGPAGMPAPDPKEEQERANAQLPPAPEESAQLEVLLRPGLLADVEIIVEKIPNAISIPNQAVFEKEGKPLVYVQVAANHFEERLIKPAKRSESVLVVAEGLKGGETIAMADPSAKKAAKNEKKGAGGALGGAPAGGAGGAGGGTPGRGR